MGCGELKEGVSSDSLSVTARGVGERGDVTLVGVLTPLKTGLINTFLLHCEVMS